jgi:hypothetical protein
MLRLIKSALKVAIVVIVASWVWFFAAVRRFDWAESGGPLSRIPGLAVASLVALPVLVLLLFLVWAREPPEKL